jgi:hypothetical protein
MGQRALEDKFDFKAFGPSLDINSNLLICFAVLGMGSVMSSIVFLFEVRKNIFWGFKAVCAELWVVYGLIKSRLSKMKLRPIFKNRRVIVFVIDLVLRVNLNLSMSCFNWWKRYGTLWLINRHLGTTHSMATTAVHRNIVVGILPGIIVGILHVLLVHYTIMYNMVL